MKKLPFAHLSSSLFFSKLIKNQNSFKPNKKGWRLSFRGHGQCLWESSQNLYVSITICNEKENRQTYSCRTGGTLQDGLAGEGRKGASFPGTEVGVQVKKSRQNRGSWCLKSF